MNWEAVGQAFHAGEVVSLSVAIRRPLVATCSSDRSIFIWNFATWCGSLLLHPLPLVSQGQGRNGPHLW